LYNYGRVVSLPGGADLVNSTIQFFWVLKVFDDLLPALPSTLDMRNITGPSKLAGLKRKITSAFKHAGFRFTIMV
jgi:hypothetical protein